ncbi:MAG: aminotransferase class IV, partial [Miltoncostaeaceae bacterium]
FCVVGDELFTAPARGLLPGIARGRVIAAVEVTERAVEETEWRAASEVFLTNALRGVIPVIRIDGRPVGDGAVGARTRSVADRIADNG